MFYIAGVSIDYMRLPEDGREVLRRSSDGSHGEGVSTFIIGVIDIVFAFSEVDKF